MNNEVKQHLLELAEDVTEDCVNKIFEIIEIYIKSSINKFDDLVLPFLPQAKDFVLRYVNKIDGAEG